MDTEIATRPRIDPTAPRTVLVQKYNGDPIEGDELPYGLTKAEVNHWNELLRKSTHVELTCEVCQKTFTSKRRDAMCCGARCRKRLQRAKANVERLARQDGADFAAITETEEYRLWQVATRPSAPVGVNDWDHMLPLNVDNDNSHRPPPWAEHCTCLSCQLTPESHR